MRKTLTTLVATIMMGLVAGPAMGQQNEQGADVDVRAGETRVQVEADRERRTEGRASGGLAYRVSDLTGMEVRNAQGEELGDIEDLVVDVESGKVRYAALSTGGFLGIGDDLFAIPWSAFEVKRQEDESYLVLNIQKQTLEDAPGFNKDNWPNFADQKWVAMTEKYYREAGVTPQREREGAEETQLRTRTDRQGQAEQDQPRQEQPETEQPEQE